MSNKPYLVGISGGSASGKTYFLKSLRDLFSESELCIISQDNYYKSNCQHKLDENGNINFDLPECIELEEFSQDIRNLGNNKTIYRNEYLFQHENQRGKLLKFKPAPIIVCEGLFIYYHKDLLEQFDLKLFISADENIAFQRRLKRDVAERNISEEYVVYQWNNHVVPAYKKYLLPFMAQADIIVNNNNNNLQNSLALVEGFFREKLKT